MFRNVKKEEIAIPAQMSYMGQVRDFIEHIGSKYKYSDKIINSYKLVIEEACTNIIRHGYRDIKGGEISIKAIIRQQSLTIVVTDQGISYDPRQAQTPDLEKYIQIGKKGGLGIFMMRKLMDDVQYNITSRGNELRLTKQREKLETSKFRGKWEKLSMRSRYTIAAAVIISLIAIVTFSVLFTGVEEEILEETMEYAQAQTLAMADNSRELIQTEDYLELFSIALSFKENNPKMVYETFIVDTSTKIVASGNPLSSMGYFSYPEERYTIQDSLSHFKVYQYAAGDTIEIYDLVANIYTGTRGESPVVGQAHVWITSDYIESRASAEKVNIIIIAVVLLVISFVGSYFLIDRIVTPFHSLADWVRQVGQGTVDEDEIDIDASDELGEIAQAFNMMTNKFREAQVSVIEQQRLQKELQVAQEIQQMLLPSDFPQVKGYDLASFYEAAKEVGGDLFDFVEVDQDTIGICVADVAGKGVPGSLIMTMIRTALRLEARGNKNPADVLSRVNRFVTDDMKRGMFVTMFYLVLDSRNRIIHYASAGHNPMILYRGNTKQTYFLNPSGFPVGIQLPDISLFDRKIEQDSIRLREDDLLVLYTDGVTEAMNPKRELYREERFLEAIRSNAHYDVSEFIGRVKDEIKSHTQGYPQNDDITYVSVKEKLMQGEVIFSIQKELFHMIEEEGINVKAACEQMQVSPYMYRKYKKIKDKVGLEGLKELLYNDDYIEKRHLSIEMKTKLFDVIGLHPEYGPKRISRELNTERYGYTKLEPRRVYDELVKAKLNTQEKRENYIKRGGKKRLKAPGTPLLTLDGQVILDYESADKVIAERRGVKPPEEMTKTKAEEPKKSLERHFTSVKKETDEQAALEKAPLKEKIEDVKQTETTKEAKETKKTPEKLDKKEPKAAAKVEKSPKEAETEKRKKEKKEISLDQKKTAIPKAQESQKVKKKVADVAEEKIQPVSEHDKKALEKSREEKEAALKQYEDEKRRSEDLLIARQRERIAKAPESETKKILEFKAPEKKFSEKDLDTFYDHISGQLDELNKIVSNWTDGQFKKIDILKIGKTLGVILTDPALKSLEQVEQIFIQVIKFFEYLELHMSSMNEKMIVQKSKEMLKYIEKENILKNSHRTLELINEIGIKNLQLREGSKDKSTSKLSELESVRRKIAQKNMLKKGVFLNNIAKNDRS